jgi:nucleoside-diphosphate-sugar epimerase
MSTIVITGGCGFLGQNLCRALLQRATTPLTVKLIDLPTTTTPPQLPKDILKNHSIDICLGDISDPTFVSSIINSSTTSIFHLAAAMSGQCETEPDTALHTNVTGTINLIQAATSNNATETPTKFVFASSGAVFGSSTSPSVTDTTKLIPETTYGMTKSICELLINDANRRGDIVGRSARLPTVIVRPGVPNAATTSIFSGVVRESLNGQPSLSPLPVDLKHAVTSHRTVIGSLLSLHDVNERDFIAANPNSGSDRGVNVHAVTTTLQELHSEAAKHQAEGKEKEFPTIQLELDLKLTDMVGSMPINMISNVATALKLPGKNDTVKTLVQSYVDDFVHGDGVQLMEEVQRERKRLTIGFIGVGHMGSGMLRNLITKSDTGTTIKIYNRTSSKIDDVLKEMKSEGIYNDDINIEIVDHYINASIGCDITMVCLSDEMIVKKVLLGSDGAGGK